VSDGATPRRMTRERWSLLEPLVDAALDLAPDRRPAFYADVAAKDPELRAELERLVGRSGDEDELFSSAAAERFALLLDGPAASSLVTDVLPQLQVSLGPAYTLERELGGGGMSRVFLAHEAELGRRVVIKVLTPELAAGINAERFDREIKLVASLQQANIVPLLATGRAAGYPYYTMPFVEGRSLRDRLAREGVLPIGEGVNLLRDVARALAYAHAQGVVHRDIKPGNVLLSGGTAVVTDFGIAKAISAARGGADRSEGNRKDLPEALTNAGSGIGTPPYMAPEQAAGDPTMDHRADIYAFGCLAYEVFTGKPPFLGDAPHLIIAAHFQETPRPVTEGRSDVPSAIATLIAQCLEKNPRRRPQSAADLLERLDAVSSGPTVPVRRRSAVTVVRGAVVALAVVVGAAAYLAYRSVRADEPNAPQPLTLAAIPFRNVSRDSALEYRADGISDEILTALGKVPGIRVVGRNAARRYRDRDIEERAVQRELGAALLITGTYEERGGRIVVSAQLNDSVAGGELAAGSFEIAPGDFRSLADSIARVVAVALHGRYASRIGEPKRGALSAWTPNRDAYEHYLEGQALLRRRGTGVKESVKSFEAAIRLDPNFARAHGALATALTFFPWFYGVPPDEVKDSVINTARRALALDSTLADAHSAIAMVYAGGGEWDKAATEFQRATALEPDNFDVHFNYGRISTVRGDLPEALRQFEQARKLEPVYALVSGWTSYVQFLNGDAESALKESARALRLDPGPSAATNLGALVHLGTGRPDEARRLIASQLPPGPMSTAPYGYAKLGDTATAMRLVRQMESTTPRPWSTDVQRATVKLALGDSAGALSALERSARTTGPLWVWLMSPRDPAYDLVRHSERFAALARQAGLDVAWVTKRRR
jgi:eukaryotic-like serine/threonine-protein kinase